MTIANHLIQAEDTRSIRHTVLWPSIPIQDQLLPFDTLSSTVHYGAFSAGRPNEPVACLTITLERYAHPDRLPADIISALETQTFPAKSHSPQPPPAQYQLHKFAVLPEYQGKGFGKALLHTAIQELVLKVREQGVRVFLFHFDARSSQMDMYKHLGFRVLDDERFMKYGSTDKGPGVEYVRMGQLFWCIR